MIEKPFSQACQNNCAPILEQLRHLLANKQTILEVGSGTGQHAVYFAQHCPHLFWQCSDLPQYHEGINLWIDDTLPHLPANNVGRPITFDVTQPQWPQDTFDAVFTANTLHIMGWKSVETFFSRIAELLNPKALLIVYGPMNYNARYTSESNRQFDALLKQRNPLSGIRDFEVLDELANKAGLTLQEDNPMPANNRLVVWSL